MNVHIRELQDYCVQIGDMTLHLSEYKIVGGCLMHEQGTASGDSTVTACFPKGTRLTLRGRLAPATDTAAAAAAVNSVLYSGEMIPLRIGSLTCSEARLIGYSLSEGEDFPEMTLLFHSRCSLVREDVL